MRETPSRLVVVYVVAEFQFERRFQKRGVAVVEWTVIGANGLACGLACRYGCGPPGCGARAVLVIDVISCTVEKWAVAVAST